MKQTDMLEGDGLEMIIVFVNASNAFGGGFYGSSPSLGDYETYIVHDLVNYVDAKYRTIPDRDSRGIAGWGTGGYGANRLAFKHPDVFGVLVNVTGLNYEIMDAPFWDPMLNSLRELPTNLNELALGPCVPNCFLRFLMIFAAEAAPNPENPPFFLDMPVTMVDGKAQIVPEIAEKIDRLSISNFVTVYLEQPVRLNAILLYQGANDPLIPQELYDGFDELLTQNGIEHEYLSLPGGLHRVPYNPALEFMVKHLSSEMP